LAQALGKTTVAEFVESEVITAMLHEMDITYGQGYYLGKPSPALPGILPSDESAVAFADSYAFNVPIEQLACSE
jgi:EAL domain-containing protein (putative c-di-GMP-specific phosphodiesterase class I)